MAIQDCNALQGRHLAKGEMSAQLETKQEGDASSLDGLTLDSAVEQLFQDRVAGDTALQTELDATQTGAGLGSAGTYSAPPSTNYLHLDGSLYLSGSTDIRDAAIKAAAAAARTSYRAGFSVDGSDTYDPNASWIGNKPDVDAGDRHYIGDAVALSHADAVLDTTVKAHKDALDNVQTELDDTQAKMGMEVNGNFTLAYNTNSPTMDVTNYFGTWAGEPACDTVVDGLTRLDAVVSVNTFNVFTNANDIAAESARIDAILDAAGADPDSFADVVNLINQVDTENDDALATVIGNLNSEIAATNGEVTALQAADAVATTDRAAIRTDFAAADSNLQNNLVTIQQGAGLDGAVGYMQNASMTYIGAAVSLADADEKLDVALAAEASTRGTAVTTLQNNIDTEKNRIDGYDNRIHSNFNVEASAGTAELHFGQGQPRMVMTANGSGEVTVCFDVKPAE